MNLDPHEKVRAEHDAAMRAYLESGGEIVRLPVGAMVTAGWKPGDYDPRTAKAKARSMKARQIGKEELAARIEKKKAEKQAVQQGALPRSMDALPWVTAPKPRVRKPAPRKVRLRNGPVAAREGTRNREALDALREAKLTAAELALKMGWGRQVTATRLQCLKKAGLVIASGPRQTMRWSAKA